MKPTMEILTKLQENSRKHHDEIFTRLFRYLLRPDIYYIACVIAQTISIRSQSG